MKNNKRQNFKSISTILITIATAYVAVSAQNIQIGNVEKLYLAVNDPANAGATLTLAPGVYMLSATDPFGAARPNGGRLDLLENMSLVGVEGDRNVVVIDAANLPASSYRSVTGSKIAAIRLGRGSNSIEWVTVQNAFFGQANIDTTLQRQGTAFVRVAHIASSGGQRGLDIRNAGGLGASGKTIEADIVDNDFFNNNVGSPHMGVRILNANCGPGTVINARMIGNRSFGNGDGRVISQEADQNSTTNIFSAGNQFFDNIDGTDILGGFASASTPSNGNTINFEAHGDQFVGNNALFDPNYVGGLVISGGDNSTTTPNLVNNNTVNVALWGCRMTNNLMWDIYGVGARSVLNPVIAPGVNNHVTIEIHDDGFSHGHWQPVEFFADSIPNDPSLNNTVTVIR